MRSSDGITQPSITAKVAQDLSANAKYWSFYIPESADIDAFARSIFLLPETASCVLSLKGDSLAVFQGFSDYPERITSSTLVFTSRVFLYIDTMLGTDRRNAISDLGALHGFHVVVRDREYAMKRSEFEHPLAFISHDSRDKDVLVRDLALRLSIQMCPVWYDEYSLKVGDSLRASIEKGLRETKKCIVVLSPHFLSNDGWTKAEFDSIFTREILERQNVILPVWHNVTKEDVYGYCPRLLDRLGLPSSLGAEELARKLAAAIKA